MKLYLTGYDNGTERLVSEQEVPSNLNERVKEIADVLSDLDCVYTHPITERQAAEIAQEIKGHIEPGRCTYFLEGYKEDG